MTENMNVLAEFVNLKEGLGIDEFKLIELMIRPLERRQKLPEPWTCREFLCEVRECVASSFVIETITSAKLHYHNYTDCL